MEEALCFGWIESKPKKRTEESYYLFFVQQNSKSKWSKLNRERLERLATQNLIMPASQTIIDLAKQTSMSLCLIKCPKNLSHRTFKNYSIKIKEHSKTLMASTFLKKKLFLNGFLSAKRPETRQQRIVQTVGLASKNIRANHYKQNNL